MNKEKAPSMDQWLQEAKKDPQAASCGMYLFHAGVVRQSARACVREGEKDVPPVAGLTLSYEEAKVSEAVKRAREMPGIHKMSNLPIFLWYKKRNRRNIFLRFR